MALASFSDDHEIRQPPQQQQQQQQQPIMMPQHSQMQPPFSPSFGPGPHFPPAPFMMTPQRPPPQLDLNHLPNTRYVINST